MSDKAVEELTLKIGGLEISVKRRADSSSAEEAGESVYPLLALAPLQSVRLPVKSVQKLPHLPAVGVRSVVLELGALSGRSNCLKHRLRRKSPPRTYSAWSICKSSCQLSSQVGLLWPGWVVPFEQGCLLGTSWTGWAATSAPPILA